MRTYKIHAVTPGTTRVRRLCGQDSSWTNSRTASDPTRVTCKKCLHILGINMHKRISEELKAFRRNLNAELDKSLVS